MSDSDKMPDISPAQEVLLKKRFAVEMGVEVDAAGNRVLSKDASPEATEVKPLATVYTNLTATKLTIADLGFKIPDGSFTSEEFEPYETKDLGRFYKPREIRASKMLMKMLTSKPPMLAEGVVSKEDIRKHMTPLARMAEGGEGQAITFTDPSHPPLIPGHPSLRGVTESINPFDAKLAAQMTKEITEELETRSGPSTT